MDKLNKCIDLIVEAKKTLSDALKIQDQQPDTTLKKMGYNGIVAAINYCDKTIQILTHANPNHPTNCLPAAAGGESEKNERRKNILRTA